MLLAEEDDPWIVYDLGESIAVRTVSVYTEGADGSASGTVYLLPQWEAVYTSVSAEPTPCDAARRMEPAAQWGDRTARGSDTAAGKRGEDRPY